jgi:hypothetical protein
MVLFSMSNLNEVFAWVNTTSLVGRDLRQKASFMDARSIKSTSVIVGCFSPE